MQLLKKEKAFYCVLIALLVFTGIFLRTLFYFYDRPFWLDEASIAINVLDKNYLDFFMPLERLQVAPPFSLILAKAFLGIIPDYEMAFRLLPFIAGILSVPVFFLLATRIFKRKIAVVAALFMFIVNYRLCYYAQEFKSYGLDIFFEYAILLSYFKIGFKESSVRKLFLISCVYALCPWFSHASCFAVTVVFLAVLFKSGIISERKIHWDILRRYLALTIPFTLSFIGLFLLQYLFNSNTEGFYGWWERRGFFNKDFSNATSLFHNNFIFFFTFSPIGVKTAYLLLIIGGLSCLKNFSKFFFILMPILLALLLSYLHLFPFGDRVVVYTIPAFILMLCAPLDIVCHKKLIGIPFTVFCFGLVFLSSTAETLNTYRSLILKEFYFEDTPSGLLKAKKLMKPEDVLFINSYHSPFVFYSRTMNLEFPEVFRYTKRNRIHERDYHKNLDEKLKKGTRYFYLIDRPKRNKWRAVDSYVSKNPTLRKIQDKHGNGLYIWVQQ